MKKLSSQFRSAIAFTFFLAAACHLSGCGKKAEEPAPAADADSEAQSAASAPGTAVEISAAELEAYEEFALALESELNSGGDITGRFDIEALLAKVTDGVGLSSEFDKGFREGARTAFPQTIAQNFANSRLAFLEFRSDGGNPRLLYRLMGADSTLSYIEMHVTRGDDGQIHVTDVYNYMAGETISQISRRLLLSMAAQQNRSILERLTRQEADWVKHATTLADINRLRLAGDFQGAYDAIQSLPDSVRSTKGLMVVEVIVTAELDEDIYLGTMERFRDTFPNDPSLALVLIDYHFLNEDYGAVRGDIAQLRASVKDPYLYYYDVISYIQEGDIEGAKKSADAFAADDPGSEDVLWSYLEIALKESDFAEVASLLNRLESEHEYALAAVIRQDENYAAFRGSEEGKTWLGEPGR